MEFIREIIESKKRIHTCMLFKVGFIYFREISSVSRNAQEG